MNINDGMLGAQTSRVRMPICDRTLNNEISNDYTLPDYLPEIRRLLHISANILPPARYVSQTSAEYNGTVDYNILYVGADGSLYSMPLSAEYGFNFPIDAENNFDFNEGVVSCADMVAENITTRLSGPRKLNIKCRIKCHARAYAVMLMEEKFSGEIDDSSIQRLNKKANVCNFTRIAGEQMMLTEQIIPDSPDVRIICARGKAMVSDIGLSDSCATVRGEVYLTLLAENAEGAGTSQIQRRVPFSCMLEDEDIKRDSLCCASACVSEITVNVEENGIIADIGLIVELECQFDKEFLYTQDIYSTDKECESYCRDIKMPVCGYCVNGNFSVNERLLKVNAGFGESSTIVDSFASAYADDITYNGEKNILSGQIKVTTVLLNDGEYSAIETVLPLRYEFDAKECSTSNASLNVVSCRVRQDTESVSIDAEIAVCAWGASSEEIIALDAVRFTDEVKKSKGDIVICYPSESDTVWSVAKRYHVPVSRIESVNSVSDQILNTDYLII